MATEKFVTAINCIDGRVHIPVINWLKASFDAEFVDHITEPGADKVLANGPKEIIHIKQELLISVNAHKSKIVAVVGHYDCAANPVSKEQHKRDVQKALATVQSWGLPVRVIGLWVNSEWQVEVVCPMEES